MQVRNKKAFLGYVSPVTGNVLNRIYIEEDEEGLNGALYDRSGRECIPIRNSIPRFVTKPADASYLLPYRRVLLDSYNNSTIMRDTFYANTCWKPGELSHRRVLEMGCQTGYFSEVVLATGAFLYSLEETTAVELAWRNNRHRANWTLCQADSECIPYASDWFDFVFCFGSLQRVPDPRRAFLNLARVLKPDGLISIHLPIRQPGVPPEARFIWASKALFKNLYRPLVKRLSPDSLLKVLNAYLPTWMPIDSLLQRIPGPLSAVVPCWNMSDLPILREDQEAWTVLATFDALTRPMHPVFRVEDVHGWFEEAGLVNIDIRQTTNGLVGNARKRPRRLVVL